MRLHSESACLYCPMSPDLIARSRDSQAFCPWPISTVEQTNGLGVGGANAAAQLVPSVAVLRTAESSCLFMRWPYCLFFLIHVSRSAGEKSNGLLSVRWINLISPSLAIFRRSHSLIPKT